MVANAVMAGRICVIALTLAPTLMPYLGAPLIAFAGVSLLLGLVLALRAPTAQAATPTPTAGDATPLKSPFDLGLVLKFAAILGVVMAAAKLLSAQFGAQGLLPVAAIAGLFDVDAITLAVTRMTTPTFDLHLGASAILLAAAVDSVSKTAIASIAGGARFGALYGGGTALAAAPAVAAYLLS